MTRTAATQFQDDLAEIEAMAVIEANGNKPSPEHYNRAFVAWLFDESQK
jgi:hypothetical protein